MKPLLHSIFIGLLGCVLIGGCKTDYTNVEVEKSTNTYVVVVGMENSMVAGACPGAAYDADRIYNLLSNYTPNIVLLKDAQATKLKVTEALTKAVEGAGEGLVIFYYSGHGGSDPFPDTGIEEKDGKDEYLLLWNTWLRDNEIWNIISKSNGRFFMISDSCHSQTQFRHPSFKIKIPLSYDHNLNESHPFSMLCWSGCPDSDYSYGSRTGGQFTNALLRHFKKESSYQSLWDKIKADKTLLSFEKPQSTVIGSGFDNKTIFR